MKYVVEYYDYRNGATSAIDIIDAPANYTAEDYIRDCDRNADQEWCDMIHAGDITLFPEEEDD